MQNKLKERTKIYKSVFDKPTVDTIWKLIRKGEMDGLEHIISTGKEADVYRALLEGNPRACKIYRYETTSFRNMWEYIEGDRRFTELTRSRRKLITIWCRKEFRNLQTAFNAGCSVPEPFAVLNNVLVMEFIGGDDAAPSLRLAKLPDYEKALQEIIEDIKRLHRAGIVHADLSEYNILVWKNKLWMIDMGQSVPTSHPKATEFLRRDVSNICRYFKKIGVKTDEKDIFDYITS
ncbi:MAG: serine protein kinase RIO [Candidatus Diapherotrites archaeon]|nr:serine protein kinase RIO [Candidatus Diapherotrites archaeon]